MNHQQTLLGLALREAGVALRVDEFTDRLVLQKAVYLLQHAKIHLGYRFRWYLRGPYSTDLTDDVFFLAGRAQEVGKELAGWELDAESRQRIGKLREWFAEGASRDGRLPGRLDRRLELLASVLFLLVTGQAAHSDSAGISSILERNNKNFSSAEVSDAVEALKAHGYPISQ